MEDNKVALTLNDVTLHVKSFVLHTITPEFTYSLKCQGANM